MKGLPMTYNRDMQEDKEPLFDAAAQLAASLEMMARGGRIDAAASGQAGRSGSTKAGWWPPIWPKRWRAPERRFIAPIRLSGKLVLESIQQGKQPLDWTADQLTAFAPEFTADMARLLDPAEGMKTRELPGGTGPARRRKGAG